MKALSLSLLLLLGACAAAPPRSAEQRQQDLATAACRQDAERIMRYRERGQQMRLDEADARLGAGAFTDSVSGRLSTDRLSAQYEQERMVERCLRGAEGAAPVPASGPRGGRGS
ncbi:hypothetical protein [Roseomonas marmotae]|uniref:Lipoprotein n=1 Tax=Roseomonas marmotae TaxID=2768161 RepID=A0ABS3KJ80_9PROT|nr:hypothetical protein [Roseomonas marmotae]MBO1077030.1 hypothetical protein [Roseomonas marmotae]QTI78428.1 hypothetical protein IAI58_12095 [Roseomonas marmotae]